MSNIRYIRAGQKELDEGLELEMGDVILLGGRPSIGKTTFATNLVDKICENEGLSCIYFSLGIDDNPAMTIDEIVKKSHEFAKEKRPSLIVIDYVQLMSETEDMFIKMKALAKELFCAILVLSQLSSQVDTREDKMPWVSDFKDIEHPEDLVDEIWLLY